MNNRTIKSVHELNFKLTFFGDIIFLYNSRGGSKYCNTSQFINICTNFCSISQQSSIQFKIKKFKTFLIKYLLNIPNLLLYIFNSFKIITILI